jgi:hypothetical protein
MHDAFPIGRFRSRIFIAPVLVKCSCHCVDIDSHHVLPDHLLSALGNDLFQTLSTSLPNASSFPSASPPGCRCSQPSTQHSPLALVTYVGSGPSKLQCHPTLHRAGCDVQAIIVAAPEVGWANGENLSSARLPPELGATRMTEM